MMQSSSSSSSSGEADEENEATQVLPAPGVEEGKEGEEDDDTKISLHDLLFGRPLCDRENWQKLSDSTTINKMIDELIVFLGEEHSNTSRAFVQANRELRLVQELPIDSAIALTSRRAVILFAIWREPQYRRRFTRPADRALVLDLAERVLPLVGPPYVKGIAQRPDSFVAACSTMYALWPESAFEMTQQA
jgi:hypothetical protein